MTAETIALVLGVLTIGWMVNRGWTHEADVSVGRRLSNVREARFGVIGWVLLTSFLLAFTAAYGWDALFSKSPQ